MSQESSNPFQCQDEILQVLYWMRGEGLGEIVSLIDLKRFIHFDEKIIKSGIDSLVETGMIDIKNKNNKIRLSLSKRGFIEGRRRFSDEFQSFVGQESHTECSDPNCDCNNPDWEGICLTNVHDHAH